MGQGLKLRQRRPAQTILEANGQKTSPGRILQDPKVIDKSSASSSKVSRTFYICGTLSEEGIGKDAKTPNLQDQPKTITELPVTLSPQSISVPTLVGLSQR